MNKVQQELKEYLNSLTGVRIFTDDAPRWHIPNATNARMIKMKVCAILRTHNVNAEGVTVTISSGNKVDIYLDGKTLAEISVL